MKKKELVIKAIEFNIPEIIPIWCFNYNQQEGEILHTRLRLAKDDGTDEWGYSWKILDDGTMGQPDYHPINNWSDLNNFAYPTLNCEKRAKVIEELKAKSQGHYLLGSLGITGFSKYTFLRGFSNSMMDFATGSKEAFSLLDKIFELETEIIGLAAESGLDGVHFEDDWGTQSNLIVSPQMWRDIFKPRYKEQFDYAHRLGLHIWFHSCGNIEQIICDFNGIGVDVMNISQPNVVDIAKVGKQLRGKQCFLVPISYQTVSISGSEADIKTEARRLYNELGTKDGGFIGYVEEYSCMGMSQENYQACISSFRELEL